jgi:hypothetical protein
VDAPFRRGRLTGASLAEALAASTGADLTYEPAGVALGDAALPGFRTDRGDDDAVRFRVVAVSRPAHPLARLGAPVARLVQRRITNGYLEALRRAVA